MRKEKDNKLKRREWRGRRVVGREVRERIEDEVKIGKMVGRLCETMRKRKI